MVNEFIRLYEAIEPAEQEGFEQYVRFFYGQQKEIVKVLEQVVQLMETHKKKLFKTQAEKEIDLILPELKDKLKRKNRLNALSDLKKWLLEFLTLQELKSNSYDAQFLTLEALRKRGLKETLSKKSKGLNAQLTGNKSLNMWSAFMKLRLDHDDYFNTENEKLEDLQGNLVHLMDNLDSFYFSMKLKYSAEMYSRTIILGEHYQPRLLKDICFLAEQDAALNPIIAQLYLPLLQLVTDKSAAAFEKLKTFLIHHPEHDSYEKLLILLYLLNFAALGIRQGNVMYEHAFLQIAKIGSDQSIFIAADYFPSRTFNNIVNVACFLKERAWAKQFIDKWAMYLNPKDKQIVESLAKARIAFEEQNFQKVMDVLWKMEDYKNEHFTLDIRILLARARYEQKITVNEQNVYCNSLEAYIRRNVENINLQTNTLNFVKILRFLINQKPKKDILNAFKEKEKNIACPDWLKAQIEKCK